MTNVAMPKLSDFMDAAVVVSLEVEEGRAFSRGDVLAYFEIEMERGNDTLACPPGLTVELIAAEGAVLIAWHVAEGDRLSAGTVLAVAELPGRDAVTADRTLRCVFREVLE